MHFVKCERGTYETYGNGIHIYTCTFYVLSFADAKTLHDVHKLTPGITYEQLKEKYVSLQHVVSITGGYTSAMR